MNRFLPALASVLVATTGVADAQRVSRITAGQLAQICGDMRQEKLCDAYIAGVADGLAGAKHFDTQAAGGDAGDTCIPQIVSTTTLRSTVRDYLNSHPDMRGKPAAVPVVDALHGAYACGK